MSDVYKRQIDNLTSTGEVGRYRINKKLGLTTDMDVKVLTKQHIICLLYTSFLEVQLKSFQDFLQLDTPPEKRKNDGLYKVFAENFPIADLSLIHI